YGPSYDSIQRGSMPQPPYPVKIWDLKTGRDLRTLTPPDTTIEARFSEDGRWAVVIGQKGGISLWDITTGDKIRDLTSAPMASTPTAGPYNARSFPNIKRGQIPNIPMPNLAEIQTMMTNLMGSMAAG